MTFLPEILLTKPTLFLTATFKTQRFDFPCLASVCWHQCRAERHGHLIRSKYLAIFKGWFTLATEATEAESESEESSNLV